METHTFRVIILKAPPENDEDQDPYITLLNNSHIPNTVVPTLQFRYKNLDILADRLRKASNYAGLIVNSPRCANALNESLRTVEYVFRKQWKQLKCFVVGKSTARILKNDNRFLCEGEDTGNLDNLLQYITKYSFDQPLLMPCGNLNKDRKTDVKIEKIEIYETIEHPDFEETFKNSIKSNDKIAIIVFFSPSGVRCAVPSIESRDSLQCIAIGPTTAKELENHQLPVSAVCEKPTPESLLKCILSITGR